MTRPTKRPTKRRAALLVPMIGGVLLAGCGGGVRDASDATTTVLSSEASVASSTTDDGAASTTASTAARSVPTTSADADGSNCLSGTWELTAVADASGLAATMTGVTVEFDGASWAIDANDATITGTFMGIAVTGGANGEASGGLLEAGGGVGFRADDVAGTLSGLGQALSFEAFVQALVPSGTAVVSCTGGTLTLVDGTRTLTMERTGGGSGPGETATTLASAPAVKVGDVVTIDTANGLNVEHDCAGGGVDLVGSAMRVTLTGDCTTVQITGNTNEVTIARVGSITVTGSVNRVTWTASSTGGEPTISNTGRTNEIRQG